MDAPKIESGIPIPTGPGGKANCVWQQTFAKMAVGDSFAVPYCNTGRFFQAAKALNLRCVARREGNNLRVWRTA
jgi:hypothetical protein